MKCGHVRADRDVLGMLIGPGVVTLFGGILAYADRTLLVSRDSTAWSTEAAFPTGLTWPHMNQRLQISHRREHFCRWGVWRLPLYPPHARVFTLSVSQDLQELYKSPTSMPPNLETWPPNPDSVFAVSRLLLVLTCLHIYPWVLEGTGKQALGLTQLSWSSERLCYPDMPATGQPHSWFISMHLWNKQKCKPLLLFLFFSFSKNHLWKSITINPCL